MKTELKEYGVIVCKENEDNTIHTVFAYNELQAMVLATENEVSWVDREDDVPFKTVDEGIRYYKDQNVSVLAPIELKESGSIEPLDEGRYILFNPDETDLINPLDFSRLREINERFGRPPGYKPTVVTQKTEDFLNK